MTYRCTDHLQAPLKQQAEQQTEKRYKPGRKSKKSSLLPTGEWHQNRTSRNSEAWSRYSASNASMYSGGCPSLPTTPYMSPLTTRKGLRWSNSKAPTTEPICLYSTPVSSLYVVSNIAPPPIRREALALKSAWKALSDKSSLLHEMIAAPAKVFRRLQAPTRTSARLNLVPRKVIEQRLTSRHPFQRAAQLLVSSVGGDCPGTANQRRSRADHYVLDKWRRDWLRLRLVAAGYGPNTIASGYL